MADISPSCSVVICTTNRRRSLVRCLKSVATVDYPNFEVLIVNNGQDDEGIRSTARDSGARYIVEPALGLSRARNCAAQNSTAEILAYIDDDCVVDRHWLAGLVRDFDDPSVAVVTGCVRPIRIETEAERLCAELRWMNLGEQRRVVSSDVADWFEAVNSQGIGFGGNMAFRRAVFQRWSGFDTRLGLGTRIGSGEENLAFLQLISLGYKIVYEPTARVSHPYPEQIDELRKRAIELHSATVAFYAFLFSQFPEYRKPVVRHLFARKGNQRQTLHPINYPFAINLARVRGLLRYFVSYIHAN